MSDRIVRFGPSGHLVGTFTPAQSTQCRGAFVLLNSGVVSRMGSHRFNVKIARHLATLGFCSLRFDLSGQGESGYPAAVRSGLEQAPIDIQSAIDCLQELAGSVPKGAIGLCSGAMHAYAAALADARLSRLFLIDGHAYRSRWTKLRYLWSRLRLRSTTENLAVLLSYAALPFRRRQPAEAPNETAPSSAPLPSREVYADSMSRLLSRGARVALLFTGTWGHQFSYRRQFSDVFCRQWPQLGAVEVFHSPHMDHTFTDVAMQTEVLELIGQWAVSTAEEPAPCVPAPAPLQDCLMHS